MNRAFVPMALLSVALATGVAFAASITVSQRDKTFAPDELTASVGQSVTIVNDDEIPHNVIVTLPGGGLHNHGVQEPRESIEMALESAGTYIVRCGIHPKMKLTVHAN